MAAGTPASPLATPFAAAVVALLAGAAAYAVALLWLPAAYVDGAYVPLGNDSFYHARRILDAIADPSAFYEFDPYIHAPEGSWITWPWAYDWGLAHLVRLLMAVTGATDAMALLVYVPPTWAFVNTALIVAIGRALGLRAPALALLGAGYALLPFTQALHGVGMIDHHFVEHTFVLLALWSGLRWFAQADAASRAMLLGLTLGIAPAFHNGLFALQIPVDAALLLAWWRGGLPPRRAVLAYAATLVVATLAVLLPSEPFHDGQFAFATLSWFHLYVATLSASGAAALAALRFGPKALVALAAVAAAALAPIVGQVLGGSRFLSATLVKLAEMSETTSVADLYAGGGVAEVARYYTGLVLLLPATAAACAILLLRPATGLRDRYVAAVFLFGAALLAFQLRLHYWGTAALLLAPLLLVQRLVDRAPSRALVLHAASAGLLAVAYAPAIPDLWAPIPPGYGTDYAYTRTLYPALAQACAERPGIVLADNNDGHHIRYHTGCAVISNNFIMTPQHEAKLLETERLLAGSARELLDDAGHVDYVFVRRDAPWLEPAPGLRAELLGDAPAPPGLELVVQALLPGSGGGPVPYARIYRVTRGAGAPAE